MATMLLTGQARFSGELRPWTHHAVFFKHNWADDWQWNPWVEAIESTQTVGPQVDQCSFEFDFGAVKRELSGSYSVYDPLAAGGEYVLIYCYDPFGAWDAFTGVVDFESAAIDGTSLYPQGKQKYTAFGLEHLLDRKQINATFTENGKIQTKHVFNRRTGRGLKTEGNKQTGTRLFGADGEEWTNLDICKYAVENFSDSAIAWEFFGNGLAILNGIVEEHDLWGLTPLQCLNELIDRRRGLIWRVVPPVPFVFNSTSGEWQPNSDRTVWIFVTTSLSFPILFEGVEVAANEDQIVLFHENKVDVKPTFHFSQLESFDEILVVGGPIMVAGTFSYADGTLEEGWTASEESDYKSPGLADADENDNARGADKFRNVYQKHRVPDDWNGYLGNGEGTAVNVFNAFPNCDRDGVVRVDVDQQSIYWLKGKLFEQDLPVLETTGVADAEQDRVRAFALIEYDDGTTVLNHFVEKPTLEDLPRARLTLSDRELAFYVEPQGLNHLYADGHFATAGDSNIEPVINYTSIIATMFFETDERLYVLADVPGVVKSETGRTKLINVPDAEYWTMVPQTTWDVQDGALVKTSDTDYTPFRDDSDRLRQIAAMAQAWYGVPRALLTVQLDFLTPDYWAASMITGVIGGWQLQPVGTVVTNRRYDFATNQTIFSTGFVELTLQNFVSKRENGSNA